MTESGGPRVGSRALVSRSMWALVAQGLSSGSNVVLSLIVLATATPDEFAIFSVCLVSYLLAAQLSRSLLSLPVLILYTGSDASATAGGEVRSVAGLSLAMGALVGVALGVAAIVSPEGRGQFAALAVLMPLLLYQDVVRHVAFARANPKAAALSDGLWLVLQVAGAVMAIAVGHDSAAVLVAVWAVAGSVSACIFGVVLQALPRFGGMVDWARQHRQLCTGLAVEFAFISGNTYLLYYGVSILAGVNELGRIRAAQTFIGPITVVLLGAAAFAVPESVRLLGDRRRLRRFAVTLSCGLAGASLAFGALAYWLLPVFGPELFEATWASARPVVPVLTVFAAALGATFGAVSPLRALDEVPWIVRTRALTGGLALVVGLLGSAWVGANGALAALAVAEILFAALAWRRLNRHLQGPERPSAPGPPPEPVPEPDAELWGPEL